MTSIPASYNQVAPEVPMPRKKRSQTTRYYSFEGSPARVHEDELRDLTGDIYRTGRGIVPADASYIYFHSFPISRCTGRIRCRRPIPIPPTPPNAARQRDWILRQLSGGQRQLRDCGRAGDSCRHEPGDSGGARHAHALRRVATASARIGGCRHDVTF
jgi:hypothetical protein